MFGFTCRICVAAQTALPHDCVDGCAEYGNQFPAVQDAGSGLSRAEE